MTNPSAQRRAADSPPPWIRQIDALTAQRVNDAALVLREGDLPGAMGLAGAASELSASTGAGVALRVRSIPDYRTPDGAVLRANSRELEAAWDEGRSMTIEEAVACALERHSAAAAPG